MSEAAIGMFDSGIGGLSILREAIKQFPNERFIYLADTHRLPYGNKSPEQIVQYTVECCQFLTREQNVKLLVIACNTASAHALEILKSHLNIPLIGVIDATAAVTIKTSKNQKIGLLATKSTVLSKAYEKALMSLQPQAQIFSVACPLLVPIVEKGLWNHSLAHLMIKNYLKNLENYEIDTLILGCTHYPFLKNSFQKWVNKNVTIVDSIAGTLKEISCILDTLQCQAPPYQPLLHQFFVSGCCEKFRKVSEKYLQFSLENLEKIFLSNFVH